MAPGNVKITSEKAGLDRDSVANVTQVVTLGKQFLTEKVGLVNHATIRQIDEGIRLVLAL